MSERHRNILFVVLLIVVALGAMATLYFSTTAGLGFGNDSVAYVGAARNILLGNGYARTSGGGEIKPITHYPPLFSLVLAAGSALLRYDPVRVARALIIFLWGLSAFLGGWLVWRMARSGLAGLAFAFLFAANGPLLFVYAVIMSEPLYISLTFGSFLALFAYFKIVSKPAVADSAKRSVIWLVVAGDLSGLAYLTRYSGLALLATLAAVLLLVEPGWKQKARSVLVYVAGALPFMLAWTLRNTLEGLSVANREFVYHPIPFEKIDYGFRQVWDWLIPGWFGGFTSDWPVLSVLRLSRAWPGTPYLAVGLVALALLAWLAYAARRLWNRPVQDASLAAFFAFTLYLFVYLAAIVFSMFFFDASTPFQDRILAPVYISLLAAFVMLMSWLWQTKKLPWRALVAVLLLAVATVTVADASNTVNRLQSDPLGYASARWRTSKTIAAINALPPDTVIYSNTPTGIYILTGRPAYIMPTPLDPVDNQPRGGFDDDLSQMRSDLQAGKAVLVIFQPDQVNSALFTQLTDGIPLYFKAGDGQIFGKP